MDTNVWIIKYLQSTHTNLFARWLKGKVIRKGHDELVSSKKKKTDREKEEQQDWK